MRFAHPPARRLRRYIDASPRLSAFRVILLGQNSSVIIASLACFLLVSSKDDADDAGVAYSLLNHRNLYLIVAVHIAGALATLFSAGSTVSIEKDWVPQISSTTPDPSAWLTDTNVIMRQIDLSCKILAPAFAGGVVAWYQDDLRGACVVMSVFNVSTICVEWMCTAAIYKRCSALNSPKEPPTPGKKEPAGGGGSFFGSLALFFGEPTALPGLALSILYMNVMSYGSIMTAYVAWRGMSPPLIGFTRGISATIGLLGTLAFKWSSACV
jgi:iron-regulated transporter 1